MNSDTARNLLIVDDESSVRRALARLLRKEGYSIFLAENAENADRILTEDSIDVILCDQDMPGRAGIDFLREAAKKFPDQRRLMISGRFQSTDVAQAMDTGAIHKFMMKPWDDAILKADIRAAFRQIMKDYGNGQESQSETPSEAWESFAKDRQLSRELHSAAADGSLSMVYQPQIALKDESIVGFEALLRWNSSTGPVGADHFIRLAERGGSMSKITHWVFREVCHRTQKWLSDWRGGRIGLNVSPVDLRDDRLLEHVEAMLERYEIPTSALQVEVTESEALNCDDAMLARLNRLGNLGISLAVDDFGAGATTLAYLADLPFSTLKIDRSLTLQLTDEKGFAVVQKVLEMAQCLEMKTTIEGVETKEHADLARSLGADIAQGYYYSKPRPMEDVEDWISSGCKGMLQ